ncbi:UDP-glucose 4-epimerase GalE [Dactylosporangium sp. CA-092794]|uniref:UDP-glucose 4-epimerase GalE n=1 Tax=Dactylosporangium sp. CA-092794 TaxID=3239929 RepID=UPI003D8E061D
MNWLVTGGAGYLGAHVVAALRNRDDRVVVVDDLSTGRTDRLSDGVVFVRESVCNENEIRLLLNDLRVDGVMHFAAHKSAPESVADPARYYRENVGGLAALLGAVRQSPVRRLLLASSAAVYGVSAEVPLAEDRPTRPINPYGHTKLICEQLLAAAGPAYGLSWCALRFFNIAGAGSAMLADHAGQNVFPLLFRALQESRPFRIAGGAFATPDGTGVRDYVHAEDAALACLAAADRLGGRPLAGVYNVGTGRGYSVRQIVEAAEEITGIRAHTAIAAARPGDPASVVANADRIQRDLGWTARRSLRDIIRSHWESAVRLVPIR